MRVDKFYVRPMLEIWKSLVLTFMCLKMYMNGHILKSSVVLNGHMEMGMKHIAGALLL